MSVLVYVTHSVAWGYFGYVLAMILDQLRLLNRHHGRHDDDDDST